MAFELPREGTVVVKTALKSDFCDALVGELELVSRYEDAQSDDVFAWGYAESFFKESLQLSLRQPSLLR